MGWQSEGGKPGFLRVAGGRDLTDILIDCPDGEGSTARLRQVVNLDSGMRGIEVDLCRRACLAPKADSAQPMVSIASTAGLTRGVVSPAFCAQTDAPVAVPGPRLGDQHKTVSGVAKAFLHQGSHVGGD